MGLEHEPRHHVLCAIKQFLFKRCGQCPCWSQVQLAAYEVTQNVQLQTSWLTSLYIFSTRQQHNIPNKRMFDRIL